MSFRSYL